MVPFPHKLLPMLEIITKENHPSHKSLRHLLLLSFLLLLFLLSSSLLSLLSSLLLITVQCLHNFYLFP